MSTLTTAPVAAQSPVGKSSSSVLSQRDQAYEQLKRMLTLGQIPAGQRLREPEWSQRLSVNRSAVREALVCLGAEGWLDRGEKTGFFVPRIDAHQIYEIMEIRYALESVAIERIVKTEKISDDDLQPLNEACEELKTFVTGGYMLGSIEADRAFHQRLIALSGSGQLKNIYNRSPLPMVYLLSVGMDDWEAEAQKTEHEHRQIIKLLGQENAEQAKTKLYDHLVDWARLRMNDG